VESYDNQRKREMNNEVKDLLPCLYSGVEGVVEEESDGKREVEEVEEKSHSAWLMASTVPNPLKNSNFHVIRHDPEPLHL